MTYTPQARQKYAAALHAYERTPLWQDRANTYLHWHGNFCDSCGGTSPTGHVDVHHRSYEDAFTGQERDEDLRALCRTCHDQVHTLTRARGGTLNLADATDTVITQGQHTRRQRDTTLPRSYAYDPRIWDAYTRNHPPQILGARYTPTRQPPRPRHHHKNALAWFVAVLIWASLLLAIISGWR